MPVEFLKHSGEPEDQVLLKTRDLVFRKEAALRKKENPEFEALLAKVDFVWIKSAFREILIKSSVDPERLNFVDPELIISDNSIEDVANHNVMTGAITVNLDRIKEATSNKSDIGILQSLIMVLLHEEVHAFSRNKCFGYFEYDYEGKRKIKIQSGYTRHEAVVKGREEIIDSSHSFELFDEGVTEKLSRELVVSYFGGHTDLGDVKAVRSFYEDDDKVKHYNLGVSLVEAMMAKIANESGVSGDMVWQSIIRGKIDGENLSDNDFKDLFAETFTEKFIEDLARASGDNEMRANFMIASLNLGKIDPDLLTRIQKRIDAETRLNFNELAHKTTIKSR